MEKKYGIWNKGANRWWCGYLDTARQTYQLSDNPLALTLEEARAFAANYPGDAEVREIATQQVPVEPTSTPPVEPTATPTPPPTPAFDFNAYNRTLPGGKRVR